MISNKNIQNRDLGAPISQLWRIKKMGRASVRNDKTVYQLYREELNLTREKASELMDGMTPSRIEKIENGQEPTPFDIIQMADCYKRPELCNYYCSHKCAIGDRYVPQV